jgi:hypothetical protein
MPSRRSNYASGQIIAPRQNGAFGANQAIQTMVQEKPPGPKLTL